MTLTSSSPPSHCPASCATSRPAPRRPAARGPAGTRTGTRPGGLGGTVDVGERGMSSLRDTDALAGMWWRPQALPSPRGLLSVPGEGAPQHTEHEGKRRRECHPPWGPRKRCARHTGLWGVQAVSGKPWCLPAARAGRGGDGCGQCRRLATAPAPVCPPHVCRTSSLVPSVQPPRPRLLHQRPAPASVQGRPRPAAGHSLPGTALTRSSL